MNAEYCTLEKCERLERENAELRDVVDRLPRTADGVPVVPGMTVYVPAEESKACVLSCSHTGLLEIQRRSSITHWPASSLYSTREAAAEAARTDSP